MPDKHAITLARSSVEPFLRSSARRDLREKAYEAWVVRGDGGGATDNKAIAKASLTDFSGIDKAQHRLSADLRALALAICWLDASPVT